MHSLVLAISLFYLFSLAFSISKRFTSQSLLISPESNHFNASCSKRDPTYHFYSTKCPLKHSRMLVNLTNCDSASSLCYYHVHYIIPNMIKTSSFARKEGFYRICIEEFLSLDPTLHASHRTFTGVTISMRCFDDFESFSVIAIPALQTTPVNETILTKLSHLHDMNITEMNCFFTYTGVYVMHTSVWEYCHSINPNNMFPCRFAALDFIILRNFFPFPSPHGEETNVLTPKCSPKPIFGVDILSLSAGENNDHNGILRRRSSKWISHPSWLLQLRQPKQCAVENEMPILLEEVVAVRNSMGYPFHIPLGASGDYRRHLYHTDQGKRLTISLWFYLAGGEFCVSPFASELDYLDHIQTVGEENSDWEKEEAIHRCSLIVFYLPQRKSWSGPTVLINSRGQLIVQMLIQRTTNDSDKESVEWVGTAGRTAASLLKKNALNTWLHLTLTLKDKEYLLTIHNSEDELLMKSEFAVSTSIFSVRSHRWPIVGHLGSQKRLFHSMYGYFGRFQVFLGKSYLFEEIRHLVMHPPNFRPFQPSQEILWQMANRRIQNLIRAAKKAWLTENECGWDTRLPSHFPRHQHSTERYQNEFTTVKTESTSVSLMMNVFSYQQQCSLYDDPFWQNDPWYPHVEMVLHSLWIHRNITYVSAIHSMQSTIATLLYYVVTQQLKEDPYQWIQRDRIHFLECLMTSAFLGNPDALILYSTLLTINNTLLSMDNTEADRLLLYGVLQSNRWATLAMGRLMFRGRKHPYKSANHGAAFLYYDVMLSQTQVDDMSHDEDDTSLNFVKLNDEDAVMEYTEMANEEFYHWMQHNYDMGSESAKRYLTNNLLVGKPGLPRDTSKVFSILYYEIEVNGVNVSMDLERNYAWMYIQGKVTERNLTKGESILKRLAEKGHRESWNTLGFLYHNHYHNYTAAMECFIRAHELGDRYGTFNMASLFYRPPINSSIPRRPVYALTMMSRLPISILAVGTPLGEAFVYGVAGFSEPNLTKAVMTIKAGAKLNPKLSKWLNEGLVLYAKHSYISSLLQYLVLTMMDLDIGIFNAAFLCAEKEFEISPLILDTKTCMLQNFKLLLSRNSFLLKDSYVFNRVGDHFWQESPEKQNNVSPDWNNISFFLRKSMEFYILAVKRSSAQGYYNLGWMIEWGYPVTREVVNDLLRNGDLHDPDEYKMDSSVTSMNISNPIQLSDIFYTRCENLILDKKARRNAIEFLPCTLSHLRLQISYFLWMDSLSYDFIYEFFYWISLVCLMIGFLIIAMEFLLVGYQYFLR